MEQNEGKLLVDHGQCPFHSERKTDWSPPATARPLVAEEDGIWSIRSYEAARTILRSKKTRQAGFLSEEVRDIPNMTNDPVLFLDGPEHQKQRKQTARFFTPSTTQKMYHQLMVDTAEQVMGDFERAGEADLSEMSMVMAVDIAAQVVGLTSSLRPGMDRRIMAFTEEISLETGWDPRLIWNMVKNQWRVLRFFWLDVKPAIKARRETPQEDIISYLLTQDYSDLEILTECITYGTAGMVTTREFISVAAWHLLETPGMYERYCDGDEQERYQILHELLRVEPVVAQLSRRTTEPLTVEADGRSYTIPADALIRLDLYAVNADELAAGSVPHAACPVREPLQGSLPLMSFGDGHHRCPGAYVAIQETDIFLRRLFAVPGLKIKKQPTVTRNMLVNGYELRRFILQAG